MCSRKKKGGGLSEEIRSLTIRRLGDDYKNQRVKYGFGQLSRFDGDTYKVEVDISTFKVAIVTLGRDEGRLVVWETAEIDVLPHTFVNESEYILIISLGPNEYLGYQVKNERLVRLSHEETKIVKDLCVEVCR